MFQPLDEVNLQYVLISLNNLYFTFGVASLIYSVSCFPIFRSTSSGKKSVSRSAADMSGMQTLTQRKGVPVPPTVVPTPQLRVAYFLPEEPIPYSMSVSGSEISLSKFKELINAMVTKRGNYR